MAAEPADTTPETTAAKRARTPTAAAANKQVAGAAARPTKDAIYAQVRTLLLRLPSQERAGYLAKSIASGPGMLAALHDKSADLLAEPGAEHHALQRALCRTMVMAPVKDSEHSVSAVPVKCSRLALVEPAWTPCFATNALPDHNNGSW